MKRPPASPIMNPFASPTATEPVESEIRRFPFDIGLVVGRYLQGLALLAIISAVVDFFLFDSLRLDLIPLLLLIFGHNLVAHRSGARRAAIWLLSFILLVAVVMTLAAVFWGTENVSITLVREIEDPQLKHVLIFAGLVFVLFGTLLWLLLTPQAKYEFAKERRLSFLPLDTPPDDWTDDDDP